MSTIVLPIVKGVGEQLTTTEAYNRHLFMPNDNKVAELKRLTTEDKAQLRAQFRAEFGYVFVNSDGTVIPD